MAEKYKALRSAIIDNEKLVGTTQYKTVADLATEYEVNPLVIYQLRYRLGYAGKKNTEKTGHPKSTPLSETILPDVRTTEGLLKILEDEPLLGPIDRLKILSRLIRTGAPAIKLSAIKLAEDLSRATTERTGPPDPLTEDEAIARLARLLMAIGHTITDKAREVAFGSPQEEEELPQGEPAPPLQPDPAPVPGPVEATNGQVPNLPPGEDPNSGSQPPDDAGEGPPMLDLQPGTGPTE
jgi:hypothetical protein